LQHQFGDPFIPLILIDLCSVLLLTLAGGQVISAWLLHFHASSDYLIIQSLDAPSLVSEPFHREWTWLLIGQFAIFSTNRALPFDIRCWVATLRLFQQFTAFTISIAAEGGRPVGWLVYRI